MKHNVFSRYFLAGLWNTVFGYGVFAGLIALYADYTHYLLIALGSNLLAITNAYVVHKLWVFRTKGNYVSEYIRYWLVYGATAGLGLLALAILVSGLMVNIYLAQAGVLCAQVIFSFMGHRKFSFGSSSNSSSSSLDFTKPERPQEDESPR